MSVIGVNDNSLMNYSRAHAERYVRLKSDGRVAQIVRRHPDRYAEFVIQMKPFSKRRHKDRLVVKLEEIEEVCEMEVLAEASK